LFLRSRTRFLQQLEHGLGDCRFGQSNSNRAPPNESRCRFGNATFLLSPKEQQQAQQAPHTIKRMLRLWRLSRLPRARRTTTVSIF